jgi:hypothetical protein
MINKETNLTSKDFNKKQKLTINGQDIFLISGVKDIHDILTINIGDKEFEIIDAKVTDEINEIIEIGQKIHSKLQNEVDNKSIQCSDIFNYMFNLILWNV